MDQFAPSVVLAIAHGTHLSSSALAFALPVCRYSSATRCMDQACMPNHWISHAD